MTLIVFGYLFTCDFTSWDDQPLLLRNPHIANPSIESVLLYWRSGFFTIYIPLTTTIWIALASIGRAATPDTNGTVLNPHVFHAANVLVHMATGLFAFEIIRRFVKSNWAAFAGALLIAIHPVQVETVGWVSGLKDLLSGCLTFAAIALYLQAADRKSPGAIYVLATGLFALALLAKPSAMLGGAIVFVIDWALLRRPWRTVIAWTAPWLALGLLCAIVARLIQPVTGLAFPTPWWSRPLIAGHAIAFYAGKIIWPAALTIDYGQNPQAVLATAWSKWAWLVPVACVTLAASVWKKSRLPLAGVAIFLIAPFHVLGWVPFDFQTYSTTADHYLYMAMLGAGLIAAWAISLLPRRVAMTAVIVFGIAMGVRSTIQTLTWQNTQTLMNHVLTINPNSWAAYTSLGVLNVDRGNLMAGQEDSDRAIALRPQDPLPWLVRGSVSARQGDLASATTAYRHAVELGPMRSASLTNLAGILAQQGQFAEAAPLLHRAIELDPDNPEAYLNLGAMQYQQNDLPNAAAMLSKTVELAPDNARAHLYLGFVLLDQGRRPAAEIELRAAARLQPDLPGLQEALQQFAKP